MRLEMRYLQILRRFSVRIYKGSVIFFTSCLKKVSGLRLSDRFCQNEVLSFICGYLGFQLCKCHHPTKWPSPRDAFPQYSGHFLLEQLEDIPTKYDRAKLQGPMGFQTYLVVVVSYCRSCEDSCSLLQVTGLEVWSHWKPGCGILWKLYLEWSPRRIPLRRFGLATHEHHNRRNTSLRLVVHKPRNYRLKLIGV